MTTHRVINRPILRLALLTLTLLLIGARAALAQTAFSYQGRLVEGGAPANGLYDFRLFAYDASTSGNQIGATLTFDDVLVTNGLFVLYPDFGAGVLNGQPRWLEVAVRPGANTGAYTTLSPRQPVLPAPVASVAGAALSLASGAVGTAQLADGAITTNKLSAGVLAGLGGAPSGALLTSFEENATNLLNSGYVKIPSLSTSVGGWNSITERNAQTIGFRNDSQSYPSTLWTGNELIIYAQDMGYNPKGTRFNPTTGLWNPLPTNGAPQFLSSSSSSSVGLVQGDSEVFVFGDINSPLNTNSAGGIFNLVSGGWRNIPTNEFFVSGAVDTCFWTGNEVLVFNQGIPAISPKGALYSPLTNGWRPMDTNGMPQVERDAAIGWTGSELFVYGKSATNFNSAVGGLYSPASNTWREVSTNGGPVGYSRHQWVYTGTELIGFVVNSDPMMVELSRFHAFNPQSNSWRPCSTNGMPSPTQIDNGAGTKPPKLFWTGSEVGMAIAKETSPTQRSVAVYLYHPQADSWRTIADNSIYAGSSTFYPPQWTGNSALFYLPASSGDIYNTLVLRPFRFTPPKTLYFYQKP